MSIHSLLSRAKELFIQPQDQDTLKSLEDSLNESDSIRTAMNSDGGDALKKMLVNDFFSALDNLFKTNEQQYIADLKAIMGFLNKLSSNQDESIKTYLENKLKDYAD